MGFYEKTMDPGPSSSSLQFDPVEPHKESRRQEMMAAVRSSRGPTPYLGLPSRLSQIWLNRWTVLLLLVLAHFLITLSSLNDNIGDAKSKALSACTKVEDIGSAMASMPHYLSTGVNRLAAGGITDAVRALVKVLDLLIVGVEQLILFFIHMMTDTYVCLISMAIHGALNITAEVANDTAKVINKGIDGIAEGLNSTVQPMQDSIDEVWGFVNDNVGGLASGADSAKDEATAAVGGAVDTATDAIGNLFGGIGRRAAEATPEPTAILSSLALLSARTPALATPMPTATTATFDPAAAELAARELAARFSMPDKPDIAGPLSEAFEKMKNVEIDPTSFVKSIKDLEQSLPDFDDIRNATNAVVSIPFDYIRKRLNDSYGAYEFDDTVFPVAAKEGLSFCSDNSGINDFFESLFGLAHTAKVAAIVILLLLAILVCVPMAYAEIRQWRRQEDHAARVAYHAVDETDRGYLWARRFSARAGAWLSSKALLGGRGAHPHADRPVLVRWCVAYATSLPALFVLSLALAGFFSCFCQWLLLLAIRKTVPELAEQVGDFAEDVVHTLGNVSARWADDANGVINSTSDTVNGDVLGHVVNATGAVNDTINMFTDKMNEGLQEVFGDTAFRDAAAGVIRCVIGLKIETVQKGLTWVHDHARVDFPLFPRDVFSLGASRSIDGDSDMSSFLSSPADVTTDEITGAVVHVVNWLRNAIIQNALIATALLLVYLLVVLLGVSWTMYRLLLSGDKLRGEGGPAVPQAHHVHDDPPAVVVNGPAPAYDVYPPNMTGPAAAAAATARGGGPSASYWDDERLGTVSSGHPLQTVPSHARKSSYAYYGSEKH